MLQPTVAAERERVAEYLEQQLVGPHAGIDEIVTQDRPEAFYSAGVLFPVQDAHGDAAAAPPVPADPSSEGTEDEDGSDSDDALDSSITLTTEQKPSAIGISFRMRGPDFGLRVAISGATYRAEPRQGFERERWRRVPFLDAGGNTVSVDIAADNTASHRLDGAPVCIRVIWRRYGNEALVTVTLLNTEQHPADEWPRTEQCFFQAKLTVEPLHADTAFCRFHDAATLSPDPEERELELLYRKHASFGTGHGCSLVWDAPAGVNTTRRLESAVLPCHSVRPLDYSLPEEDAARPELVRVLSTAYLAEADDEEMLASLDALCGAYERWIDGLREAPENQDIPPYLSAERDRLLGRTRSALDRMNRGVQVLRDSETAREAFRLANRAMLMQSRHSRPDMAGSPEPRPTPWAQFPQVDYISDDPLHWRPFQLAFLLLNIEPLVDPHSPARAIVDLIWFPTGGGKTEAYLGVSAFSIFLRRLAPGENGGGTSILMRYSLRLLTSQQFERASALICACEMLRQADPSRLGAEPVTIGLWVGADATPNSYLSALKTLEEAAGERSPFPVLRCPWCGMQIKPGPINNLSRDGIDASPADFRLFCPQPGCPFHARLPVNFVDQYLYANPPTLLLGTVDKFAMLPWGTECGAFFGRYNGRTERGPDLIIQDELHLMSGPLGTVVGLYETVIDELCRRDHIRAKIIASTATIRRAAEQVRSLYARDVLQFPPAGLHADDSYFARTDTGGQGRLYVGVLLPGITSTTAAVRTFAALLQAPRTLGLTGDAKDTYWTLVAYFNSLRELGKAETLSSDDIPARMRVIAPGNARPIPAMSVENLTSQAAGNVAEVLEKLRRPADQRNAVSLLLSSSMISVGVDVSRLGLMVVNGQPKTTAEYIQASSRVGRQRGRPGLVVMLYSPTKPRDRSHYERFQMYHAAFYRHVEPTSVTPFAPPTRDRALHAVLVALARHLVPGLRDEEQATQIDAQQSQQLIAWILGRVAAVDPAELDGTRQELQDRIDEWVRLAGYANQPLRYTVCTEQYRRLLKNMTETGPAWPTLRSMRNVDVECLLRITE